MDWKRISKSLKTAYAAYDRFMEKQGFWIVLVVCVAIIAASASYALYLKPRWAETEYIEAETAGAQQSQTLQEAQQLVSGRQVATVVVPTEAPFVFVTPVDGFLIREFTMKEPQYFAVGNYFRLHPAVDLQADYGTSVKSCANGEVLRVWEDSEKGLCVRISHEKDYEAVYAGLSDASYVKAGDNVLQGQTIGHLGNGVLDESDAEPHLHLEVWLNQTAVNPISLFLGIEN